MIATASADYRNKVIRERESSLYAQALLMRLNLFCWANNYFTL